MLVAKYPCFLSFDRGMIMRYIRMCCQQSMEVSGRLLDLGIDVNRSMTKGGSTEQYGNMSDVMNFLSGWMSNSNYVEIAIIEYADGRIATYRDDRNTASEFFLPFETRNNDGYRYFPAGGSDKPVVFVAHTHRSGPDPSEQDLTTLRDGITSAIYYQGTMYKFDKNGRIK